VAQFSATALANQVGIRDAGERIWMPGAEELARGRAWALERVAPRTPDDEAMSPGLAACLPGQAFLFNDEIEHFVDDGGPHGLGFVRARKRVDPEEWFFKAHPRSEREQKIPQRNAQYAIVLVPGEFVARHEDAVRGGVAL
jgi:hypothetical protein